MSVMQNVADALRRLHHWRFAHTNSFYDALFDAIARADTDNTARLRTAFPHEVDAFEAYVKYGDKYFSHLSDM